MAGMPSSFDGIDDAHVDRGPAARRLTPAVMDALRRRRTGVARGVRRPLQRDDEELDDDLDDSEDVDSEDSSDGTTGLRRRRRRRRYEDDGSLIALLLDCFGPRCFGAVCMLMLAATITSFAISYGIIQPKSYEDIVTPIRVAKQRWLHKKPTSADDGFILFDRNADGIIDQRDLRVVAKLTTGETPPDDALQAYIRRGDMDGDLALNETEYLLMLAAERASGKGKGKGQSKGSSGVPPPER